MVCYLVGTKPLPKPMPTSHHSHPKQQTSMKQLSKLFDFVFIDEITLKVIVCNFVAILSKGRWVNTWIAGRFCEISSANFMCMYVCMFVYVCVYICIICKCRCIDIYEWQIRLNLQVNIRDKLRDSDYEFPCNCWIPEDTGGNYKKFTNQGINARIIVYTYCVLPLQSLDIPLGT